MCLNQLDPEENEWVNTIESLRKNLAAENRKISFVFCGAGVPNRELSEGLMDLGQVIASPMRHIAQTMSKGRLGALVLFHLTLI